MSETKHTLTVQREISLHNDLHKGAEIVALRFHYDKYLIGWISDMKKIN